MCGAGVLALPFALRASSLLIGSCGLVFSFILSASVMHMLTVLARAGGHATREGVDPKQLTLLEDPYREVEDSLQHRGRRPPAKALASYDALVNWLLPRGFAIAAQGIIMLVLLAVLALFLDVAYDKCTLYLVPCTCTM